MSKKLVHFQNTSIKSRLSVFKSAAENAAHPLRLFMPRSTIEHCIRLFEQLDNEAETVVYDYNMEDE